MRTAALIPLAAVLALGACAKRTEPLATPGVCYHVVGTKDGALKYNKLVDAPNLETCAGALEAMRLKFLRLGGGSDELLGSYQANYIFLQREGVFTSTSLEGPRYLAWVRSGDGRLVIPGAMPHQ
jgi:hypothetical protein